MVSVSPTEVAPQLSAEVRALLVLARNPATPPARLRQIAEQAGWPPRRLHKAQMTAHDALAANPSSPPDLLRRLMGICPDALCENPALPLLALEASDFFQADTAATARLLRSPRVPCAVARQIESTVAEPDIADDARRHVSLAGEAEPDAWPGEVRAYWRARVAAAAPEERAEYAGLAAATGSLGGVAGDPELSARFRRALSPDTGPLERAEAASDPSWYVRLAAALNPMTAFTMRTYLLTRLSREAFQSDHRLAEYGQRRPESEQAAALCAARAARDRVRHSAFLRELPLWTFVALSDAGSGSDVPPSLRLTAADSHVWWQRLGAALGLRPAAGDPDRRVQVADALARLSEDGNRPVRAAAHWRAAHPYEEFRL